MSSRIVTCRNIHGEPTEVEASRLSFRPSVYGIIVDGDEILLCNTRSTGKWCLPGGGVDPGEHVIDALHREVHEECGIVADFTEEPVAFAENFFMMSDGQPEHILACFYRGVPKSRDVQLLDEHEIEAEKPQFVPITSLRAEDMQAFGDVVLRVLDVKTS